MKPATNYQKQKAEFLDNLQPDDFRNAGSFNQAEIIIDQLNEALLRNAKNNKNSAEFIKKAVTHLFRADSLVVAQAINLSQIFLEENK